MQYIRKNWFDIGTMLWAIGLLVASMLWVAGPAFAEEEGDEACMAACYNLCESSGGCAGISPGEVNCWVYCETGEYSGGVMVGPEV